MKEDGYACAGGVREVAAALARQAATTQLTSQPVPAGLAPADVALTVWEMAPVEIKRLAGLCELLEDPVENKNEWFSFLHNTHKKGEHGEQEDSVKTPPIRIKVAPPKGMARGFTKATTDARVSVRQGVPAGARASPETEQAAVAHNVARLFDVARAMVECATMVG